MPKSLLFIAFILLGPASTVYGQMLSSFQSPQYFRMLSRSASTDIDGIIYNPAGLSRLDQGWHFLVSGQFSPFEKVVDSEYPSINTHRYTSRTYTTPSPTLFAVHNKERWAWSLGLGQNLGEGASNFSGGIPSFEIYTSRLLNQSELGIEDYSVTQNFQITPENYTVQAGATFKMSDIFSIYAGVRMTSMKYDISGYFKNARVKIDGQLLPASSYLAAVGETYRDKAPGLADYTTALKEIGDAGAAFYSLDMMQTVGVITEAEKNLYIAELISLGKTTANGSWTVSQAYNEFDKAQKTSYDKGTDLINTGLQYQDRNIDVRKSGFGVTPIFGFNLQPSESVNMGFFYEYKGYIRTKTRSISDFNNIFADNDMINTEIPSLFSAGIGLRVNPYTEIQFSYRLYFTKEVSWGYNFREKLVKDKFLKRDFENHDFDLALGLQFHMTDNFDFSIGGMSTQPGAATNFQSDFSFTIPSYTVAGGFSWKMNEKLTLDAGLMSTFYKDVMIVFTDTDLSTGKYYETYGKNAMGLGIGLSYKIEKYYRRRY